MLKALGPEEERNEGDVAGIHGLEGEPGGGAVEVRVVYELLDRFQNLLQKGTLHETEFQHRNDRRRRLFVTTRGVRLGFERILKLKWK